MRSKSRTQRGVDLGPVTIDGVTVALRAPRLSDGPSWRDTALRFADRLSPAFQRDDMDWESAHSPVMWADTWRSAIADARAGGVSYLLIRIDGGAERVVGHFSVAGRDPRTGGAEVSTWSADVSPVVSAWAQLTTALSAFETNPAVPHALAPVAVANIRTSKFAASLGWIYLQTRRALRRYDGQISDHHVSILANTAEGRDSLRRKISEIPATTTDFDHVARRWPRGWEVAGWLRHSAIGARQRLRSALQSSPPPSVLEISSASGEVVRIEPSVRDGYRVTVAQRPAGSIDVHSDAGTATTELVPKISPWVPEDTRVATITQLAQLLAHDSFAPRRTVVTIRKGDAVLEDALAALGFLDEGEAPPSLGEESGLRRMWTLIQIRD